MSTVGTRTLLVCLSRWWVRKALPFSENLFLSISIFLMLL